MIQTKNIILVVSIILFSTLETFSQSVGGTTSGSTSYCSGSNSGFISLVGHNGTILFWQTSVNAGATWTNESNTTSTHSYLNLTQTTHFRAVVQDGSFLADTSSISIVTIHTPSFGGTITGGGSFCNNSGTGTLTLNGNVGTVQNWMISTNNGISWTNISNTTNTLNHPNITQNTLYAAVVENVSGCPLDTSSFASFIIDSPTLSGTILSGDTVCYKDNIDTLTLNGYNGNIVDWEYSEDNGTTWNSLGISANSYLYTNLITSTLFRATVKNGVCATETTQPIEVEVLQPPLVNAGADTSVIRFQSVTLNGTGSGTPSWSPTIGLSSPNIFTPLASPEETTTYILTVTDINGCVNTDSVKISVTVPIPNAISPNGDGVNDFFIINEIDKFLDASLKIFNRHGNIVYDKKPYQNNFEGISNNGSQLPDGMYYYLLDFGNGEPIVSGNILIKR